MVSNFLDPEIRYSLDPNAAAREDCSKLRRAERRALARLHVSSVELDELMVLFGLKGATTRLVASNSAMRLESTRILVDRFRRLVQRGSGVGGRRYWHVSFLGPLINEYRPELDVDAYRKVVDRLLRSQALDAIFSIELQAVTNYPYQGCGRSFLLNAHALAWTDDAAFDEATSAAAMCASPALRSEFGARTVKFTAREDASEVPYLGYYMTKLPAWGKRRRRDPVSQAHWELCAADVTDPQLLRLAEILSQLEVTDLVWGVKRGKDIRRSWKQALTTWNRERCRRQQMPLDGEFDVAELWRRVRSREGNCNREYRPLVTYGPRPRPLPLEPLPRQAGKRIWPDRYKALFAVERPSRATNLDDAVDRQELDDVPSDLEFSSAEPAAITRMKAWGAKR